MSKNHYFYQNTGLYIENVTSLLLIKSHHSLIPDEKPSRAETFCCHLDDPLGIFMLEPAGGSVSMLQARALFTHTHSCTHTLQLLQQN